MPEVKAFRWLSTRIRAVILEKIGERLVQIETRLDDFLVVESQLETENSSISRQQTLLILNRSKNCWGSISLKCGRRNWQLLILENPPNVS